MYSGSPKVYAHFLFSEICQYSQKRKKKNYRNDFLCQLATCFLKLLVLGWATVCLNYGLNSSWHTFNKIFDHFWLDWLPSSFNTSFEWRQAGRLVIMNSSFDFRPEILDWVKVRTLGWPREDTKIFFFGNATTILLRWRRALSSWNQPSPFGKCRRIVGIAYLLIVFRYVSSVTEPTRGIIGPTPFAEKHPQNIRDGLCFTVAETQVVDHSSDGSRHTRL